MEYEITDDCIDDRCAFFVRRDGGLGEQTLDVPPVPQDDAVRGAPRRAESPLNQMA